MKCSDRAMCTCPLSLLSQCYHWQLFTHQSRRNTSSASNFIPLLTNICLQVEGYSSVNSCLASVSIFFYWSYHDNQGKPVKNTDVAVFFYIIDSFPLVWLKLWRKQYSQLLIEVGGRRRSSSQSAFCFRVSDLIWTFHGVQVKIFFI